MFPISWQYWKCTNNRGVHHKFNFVYIHCGRNECVHKRQSNDLWCFKRFYLHLFTCDEERVHVNNFITRMIVTKQFVHLRSSHNKANKLRGIDKKRKGWIWWTTKKELVLICNPAPQFLLRNQTTIYKTACSFKRTAGSLRFLKCPKPMVLWFLKYLRKTRIDGSL